MKEILDSKYIKGNLIYFIFTFLLLVFVLTFSESLYGIFGVKNYTTIHLMIEMLNVVVTMSIAIQIWLTTRFYLINKDIYLGAIFLALAILTIIHTISYKGMPFFIIESSPYQATWFYMASRLLLSFGLLAVLLIKVEHVTPLKRRVIYTLSLLLSILFIVVIYSPNRILPALVIEGTGTTDLKNFLQYSALVTQLVIILNLIRQFRNAPKRNFLFICASVFIVFSDIFFTLYKDVYDIYNFMGHLFQFLSHVMIFRAIYFTAVEFPFKSMLEANADLEKSKKAMHQLAYYDEITNLPNERYLMETLNKKFLNCSFKKSVILMEFDKLPTIKSTLGTIYSEQMLKMAAERIGAVVGEKYFVSKLRIDQFVIFINEEKSNDEITQLCKRLQEIMAEPFQIQHFSLIGSLNIGVAHYPFDATSSKKLIKHAQFAMYEASEVPERLLFYKPSMLNVRTNRVELENDLYKALENNELFLQYQPQLNLKTGKLDSMEALVRWNHPQKGWISPMDFIPIAEESGLIIPFGRWVLETACRQTMELQSAINKPVKVAVNLSVGQLFQENFVQIVKEVLEETKLPSELLELEITESMTMNTNYINPVLKGLKELGITVAIDDFGTGYSSLSYLKDLPIDCLKIDRSFVQNICNDNNQEPLVDLIISMAQHLKLNVVAEGIETEAQLNYLRALDCDIIQGYYISKPIHYHELVESFKEIQYLATGKIQKI